MKFEEWAMLDKNFKGIGVEKKRVNMMMFHCI